MSEDRSGETMCYVAKGKCGHYYYAAVDDDSLSTRKEIAKEIKEIVTRGDTVERKTVQWVRDGGLDWTDACRNKVCAGQPTPQTEQAIAGS